MKAKILDFKNKYVRVHVKERLPEEHQDFPSGLVEEIGILVNGERIPLIYRECYELPGDKLKKIFGKEEVDNNGN